MRFLPAHFPSPKLSAVSIAIGIVIAIAISTGVHKTLFESPWQLKQPIEPIQLNAAIKSDPEATPLYVQSGYVNIGHPADLSTYKFGSHGDITKFLQNDEFQASGIYAYRDSRWQRIGSLEELVSGDFVIVTFYTAYSYSDAGDKGKTILGIVDWLERANGQLRLRFLDDPQQQEYSLYQGIEGITRTTPIDTDDPTGLFDFGDDLFDSVNKGSTLRLLVNDDQLQVIAATLVAPNMNIKSDQVSQLLFFQDEGVYKLTLAGRQKPLILDRKIKVVQKGAETVLKSIEDIPAAAKVRIMYYAWGDRDIAVSLDYE